jgi:hypothetical protein
MNTDIQKAYPATGNDLQAKRSSVPLTTGRNTELGDTFETEELMKTLIAARNEWLDAVGSFEHAYEEELVDYYTYKMKACEARYTYFIRLAKDKGLTGVVTNIPGAV